MDEAAEDEAYEADPLPAPTRFAWGGTTPEPTPTNGWEAVSQECLGILRHMGAIQGSMLDALEDHRRRLGALEAARNEQIATLQAQVNVLSMALSNLEMRPEF